MMGELDPTRKKSAEQFPLLKVVTEGAAACGARVDACRIRAPRSLAEKISEYATACGMTLLLLSIAMLGIFSLSLAVHKRQSVLVKYLNEKYQHRIMNRKIGQPPIDVFYHKILPMDSENFFQPYSSYLADMAQNYPYLTFNVFFLLDDGLLGSRRTDMFRNRIERRHIQSKPKKSRYSPESSRCEIANFMNKYPNVNITTTLLSKHLESTPFMRKWQILPSSTVQYYCRVFSVWKHGGIAMDLDAFDNAFQFDLPPDPRIKIIFDRQNEGLGVRRRELENVPRTFNADEDEATMFFVKFYSILSSILPNSTSSREVVQERVIPLEKQEVPLIRKHRNKREVKEADGNSTDVKKDMPILPETMVLTQFDYNKVPVIESNNTNNPTPTQIDDQQKLNSSHSFLNFLKFPSVSDVSQDLVTIFFDVGFDLKDSFVAPVKDHQGVDVQEEPEREFGHEMQQSLQYQREKTLENQVVVLETRGKFVSSSVQYHAFLGRIVHYPGYLSSPSSIVEAILASSCYKNKIEPGFCSDIYFL